MQVNARTLVAALSVAAAACTLAAADPKRGGTTTTAKTTTAEPATTAGCAVMHDDDAWPMLAAPADPWRAIADGKPIGVTHEGGSHSLPDPTGTCDAAHDHCMRDCTWLVTEPVSEGEHQAARAFHFMAADGKFEDAGDSYAQPGYVAYRSVPATKANLAVGELVFAIAPPARDARGIGAANGLDYSATSAIWDVGTVESIDFAAGTLRLVDRDEPYFLSVVRVPVVKLADGAAKAEAIKGVDATVPKVADVFLPTTRTRTVSDPWSQVDKKKQPVAVADPGAALTKFDDECTAATDHCLRPWVWFVDIGADKIIPARWTGKAWRRAADPDSPVEGARLAYRTRPAKEAEVKVGAKVLVYESQDAPRSEYQAHMWGQWLIGKVTSVDATAHRFDIEGEASHFATANARVLVLWWMTGEKAEAVE